MLSVGCGGSLSESIKNYRTRLGAGFFSRFMQGQGLDIGYKGYDDSRPVLSTAVGIDLDFPGYDGLSLPFKNESQDYVYSSHVMEHIGNYVLALREWYRVLRYDGFLICIVPHKFLYEKKADLPSRFNADHKRFYTPASLLVEVENSLEPNSYRVMHLKDNADGFDYLKGPLEHSSGAYEIELVLKKIEVPQWSIE